MDKKTVIQLFLSSVIIVIFLLIFFKYFNQETSTKKIDNIEKETSKSLNEKSNLIKDIEYFSRDETGSIYNINAESGEINDNNPDIIFLTNVKAKISTLNSEDILIESNFAKYNSKNYDTNFYENIKVKYVSGAFEIPSLISKNIKKFNAFLALGCIIKGSTDHYYFISQAVATGLMNLSIKT